MSQFEQTVVVKTLEQTVTQKQLSNSQTLRKFKELTLDEKEKALTKRGWIHEYAGYDNPNNTSNTTTGADGSD